MHFVAPVEGLAAVLGPDWRWNRLSGLLCLLIHRTPFPAVFLAWFISGRVRFQ
jgi:hypothetical protein